MDVTVTHVNEAHHYILLHLPALQMRVSPLRGFDSCGSISPHGFCVPFGEPSSSSTTRIYQSRNSGCDWQLQSFLPRVSSLDRKIHYESYIGSYAARCFLGWRIVDYLSKSMRAYVFWSNRVPVPIRVNRISVLSNFLSNEWKRHVQSGGVKRRGPRH